MGYCLGDYKEILSVKPKFKKRQARIEAISAALGMSSYPLNYL
jgi:hypothetical protein